MVMDAVVERFIEQSPVTVMAPMQEGKSPLARDYRVKLVDCHCWLCAISTAKAIGF